MSGWLGRFCNRVFRRKLAESPVPQRPLPSATTRPPTPALPDEEDTSPLPLEDVRDHATVLNAPPGAIFIVSGRSWKNGTHACITLSAADETQARQIAESRGIKVMRVERSES